MKRHVAHSAHSDSQGVSKSTDFVASADEADSEALIELADTALPAMSAKSTAPVSSTLAMRFASRLAPDNRFVWRVAAERAFRRSLTQLCGTIFNFVYVVVNLYQAFATSSPWFFTFACYYLLLGLARGLTINAARRDAGGVRKSYEYAERYPAGRRAMLATGVLLLLLAWVLSGVILLTIHEKVLKPTSTIMGITNATYTFTMLAVAIVGLVKTRGWRGPLWRTLSTITLANASVSFISLETTMSVTFQDGGDISWVYIMVAATGAAICALTVVLGILLVRVAQKRM